MTVNNNSNFNSIRSLIEAYNKDKLPENKGRIDNFLHSLEMRGLKFPIFDNDADRKALVVDVCAVDSRWKNRIKALCTRSLLKKSPENESYEKPSCKEDNLTDGRNAATTDEENSPFTERRIVEPGMVEAPLSPKEKEFLSGDSGWIFNEIPKGDTQRSTCSSSINMQAISISELAPFEQQMAEMLLNTEPAKLTSLFEGTLSTIYTRLQSILNKIDPENSRALEETLLQTEVDRRPAILGEAITALFFKQGFSDQAELTASFIDDSEVQPSILQCLNEAFP